MHIHRLAAGIAAVLVVWPMVAVGQAASPSTGVVTPLPGDPASPTVPALTPIQVEILADLGSKISKTGDVFPLRLAAPIMVDGRLVVAAGAGGMGEVIHAKKSGGSGAAGELVLAARYLDIDGRRLRLRSMTVNANGRSNIGTVNAINIASAPLAPIGLIGFMIHGTQSSVPKGTLADAKTAEPFALPPGDHAIAARDLTTGGTLK